MRVILSHPTGNANVRAAANGLANENILAGFHTSIASFKGDFWDKLSYFKAFSEISRRHFDTSVKPYIKTHPICEVGRIMANKLKLFKLIKHEIGPFCIDAVYRNIDKYTTHFISKRANTGVDGVYAYEDGAVATFQMAKKLKIQCLYDLPIGYWRAARDLLIKEKGRRPDWFSTITGFEDSEAKLLRKDKELRLADRIFVASQFTAKTLKQYPGILAPIEVIPYGFPLVFDQSRTFRNNQFGPLKALYVGSLSQRKGIADLFAVMEKLDKHVTLTIVGSKVNNSCAQLDNALAKHIWFPSLPHGDVLQLMREADVLLFPSLFEGFGLVITEAMSQGTPVITTERTAGPDIISNGEDGWIIEAGSENALYQAMEELLCRRRLVAMAGSAAMEKARLRPWSVYGAELATAIKRHFENI